MIWIFRGDTSDDTAASGSQWVRRHAATVNTYITQICGPARGPALTDRALGELARAVSEVTPPAQTAAVLGRTARAIALEALSRDARSPRARARRLLARHLRCAGTPDLLRERAGSEISQGRLDRLYRHLDRCRHCADMAARCDAAEWYLETALDESDPASASIRPRLPPVTSRPDGDAFMPTRAPAKPAQGSLVHWAAPAGGAAAAAPARRRFRRSAAAAAATLLLVLAVAILVLVLPGGGGTGARQQRAPTTPASHRATATTGVPARPPRAAAPGRPLRDPFVVGGARFAVFLNPTQGWDGFLRTSAGRGLRWIAVTVRVRNIRMAAFDPRVLTYRVVDRRKVRYPPVPSLGTAPALRQPPRPLPIGGLIETHLGFRIPRSAAGLQLRFRAAPSGPAVAVSLGE